LLIAHLKLKVLVAETCTNNYQFSYFSFAMMRFLKNSHRPELTEPTKSSSDRKELLTPLLMNSSCCIFHAGNYSYALIVFKGIYSFSD